MQRSILVLSGMVVRAPLCHDFATQKCQRGVMAWVLFANDGWE